MTAQDERVTEQEKEIMSLAVPMHQIVFKMKMAEFLVDGVVDRWSHGMWAGGCKANINVTKESTINGKFCGVFLQLKDGPFPCRVSFTMEVVHWDGKPESACKIEDTIEIGKAIGMGRYEFISLRKLTAAASPYVKNGHITFIITFRFLPVEEEW